MKGSKSARVVDPTSPLIPLILITIVAAAFGGCGVDHRLEPAISTRTQQFEESVRERRFKEVDWRILWERGGSEADTVLLMPSELSTDGRYVYVYDMAEDRLSAFRAADGSVAWTAGRRGSGPQEFRKAEDITFGPPGEILLADPNNGRIAVLDTAGTFLRHIPLNAVPYATSTCSIGRDRLLVSTLGSMTRPVLVLSGQGELLSETRLPWPDLEETPAIAQQGFFVRTQQGRCIYILALGRGFTVHDGSGFQAPRPFVESYDLPTVQLIPGERGAPPSTRVLNRTEAALGAGVDEETLAIGFWGKTKAQGELIDVYSLDGGRYLHTHRAPMVFSRMARAGNVFFFDGQRDGYPVLVAAEMRERAAADLPSPAAR
jgi:hypothetical protein